MIKPFKYLIVTFYAALIFVPSQAQTTKQLTLSNGDGWYRIIQQNSHKANGMVRIYGTSGNNRSTGITMFISVMAYSQGGSINIVDNIYYNSNHVAEIRAGSVDGNYVLDVRFEYINNPTSVYIQTDGLNLTVLDTALYNNLDEPTGLISISGKVIGASSTKWPVHFSQKVGIGTTSIPVGYSLSVDGKAIMEEIQVSASANWPDYVFSDTYQLNSLSEVSTYIRENQHLPGIPTAEEVAENGIKLGEMNAKLLEKIEELTLYLIEQNEKIETVLKENKEMKESIEKQNQIINQLTNK